MPTGSMTPIPGHDRRSEVSIVMMIINLNILMTMILCHGDRHGNGNIAGVHHSLVNGSRSEVSISFFNLSHADQVAK